MSSRPRRPSALPAPAARVVVEAAAVGLRSMVPVPPLPGTSTRIRPQHRQPFPALSQHLPLRSQLRRHHSVLPQSPPSPLRRLSLPATSIWDLRERMSNSSRNSLMRMGFQSSQAAPARPAMRQAISAPPRRRRSPNSRQRTASHLPLATSARKPAPISPAQVLRPYRRKPPKLLHQPLQPSPATFN